MQPGVLDKAPKTFIATLNKINPSKKRKSKIYWYANSPQFQFLMSKEQEKILSIVEQMTWALQIMALFQYLQAW